ncbi:MAG: class I adenylate-forming enzyme family protein [Halobacteriales archaeon]
MDVRTLKFSLNRAAKWYPDHEAFVQGFAGPDRRYTFAEANDAARRIANGLADLGIEHGDRIALLNDSTVEHALAHYGATKIGAVPAAVHAREAPNPIAEMVNRIRASALIFHPRYAEKVDRFRDQLTYTDTLIGLDTVDSIPAYAHGLSTLMADAPATEPDVTVEPDDMAFLNFSSGTTGTPKALVTRHEQITTMLQLEAGGMTEEWRVLNAFSPPFMGWENVALTNVHAGATTVFHDGDVRRVPELAENEELTRISLVTTPWRLIHRSGNLEQYDLSSVESAGISGEPINPELYWELAEQVTENIGTGYGLTETMGSGTGLPARLIDEETIESVGKPGMGCDVRVIDPDSQDPDATVPDGEVGEVIINGPSVCQEIWEDPDRTAETFHEDGWVFTGDLGHIEDGFLYLEGRSDNMIISGGINVYPERVERVLEDHPDIAECAIIGVDDEEWGERVVAYVIPLVEELTAEALEEWCLNSDDLADYQRPREYVFVETLPRNSADKLDRTALREQHQSA